MRGDGSLFFELFAEITLYIRDTVRERGERAQIEKEFQKKETR